MTIHRKRPIQATLAVLLLATALGAPAAAADRVTIGTTRLAASAPVFIAAEKHYFADEGLDAQLVYFGSSEPIAAAVASGAVDFGVSALSAALYGLAAQGELQIIAGGNREAPGFRDLALVASTKAWDSGLKTCGDLAGHTAVISQIGSVVHYSLALAAEHCGVDFAKVNLLQMPSIAGQLSAIVGGQADVAAIATVVIESALREEKAKLLTWIGDIAPWQVGGVYASTRTVTDRGPLVQRFLSAFRRATRDYHEAFTAVDGTRADNRTSGEVLAIISAYVNQPPDQIAPGVPFIDRDARLDLKDIAHQIAWFRSQDLLKSSPAIEQVVAMRFVVPLPVQ